MYQLEVTLARVDSDIEMLRLQLKAPKRTMTIKGGAAVPPNL